MFNLQLILHNLGTLSLLHCAHWTLHTGHSAHYAHRTLHTRHCAHYAHRTLHTGHSAHRTLCSLCSPDTAHRTLCSLFSKDTLLTILIAHQTLCQCDAYCSAHFMYDINCFYFFSTYNNNSNHVCLCCQ